MALLKRERGLPPSPNGASSMHLWWESGGVDAVRVSVDLEILEPPAVPRLYFWAIQASFVDSMTGRLHGGAHLGLQHHPAYPGSKAANWGGYAPDGSILDGTESALPSAPDDPNTRDFHWAPGLRYRLSIERAGDGQWRGVIEQPESDVRVIVRELVVSPSADSLTSIVVWTESFAACDDPPVAVRWSNFTSYSADGEATHPLSLRARYQAYRDGGCTNTTAEPFGSAVI
ncbi:MAG: hypothetical protein HKN93_01865, partial [Acidimicrobiia bacterium]|nr:hypothetical protein [Acidimicrobiia bacterium]